MDCQCPVFHPAKIRSSNNRVQFPESINNFIANFRYCQRTDSPAPTTTVALIGRTATTFTPPATHHPHPLSIYDVTVSKAMMNKYVGIAPLPPGSVLMPLELYTQLHCIVCLMSPPVHPQHTSPLKHSATTRTDIYSCPATNIHFDWHYCVHIILALYVRGGLMVCLSVRPSSHPSFVYTCTHNNNNICIIRKCVAGMNINTFWGMCHFCGSNNIFQYSTHSWVCWDGTFFTFYSALVSTRPEKDEREQILLFIQSAVVSMALLNYQIRHKDLNAQTGIIIIINSVASPVPTPWRVL